MSELLLIKVTKYFDKTQILKDINFEVKEGEFCVLVGPSGCGKSTILRLIAGLEEVTSGEIYLQGIKLNDLPPKERDVAMVFQNYALYPHFTVFENLAFPLKLRRFQKDKIRERVLETADILGISSLLQRKPKALSGGERQRVALGRAIVRKPNLFLFDEPLSNLDAMLRIQMRGELLKLHKNLKTSILYVTHDQLEAMTLGDRILVLKEGTIQQIGTPLQLYSSPSNIFVAGFIGSPPINLLKGKINFPLEFIFEEKYRLSLPDKWEKILKDYLGKEIYLGIRPEDIHIATEKEEIKLELEQIEPTGGEIFLYFRLGEKRVVVRQRSKDGLCVGAIMGLNFDLDKVLYFDVNNGDNILKS
ncbi:MAG: sn-glycerol-3-phosphate ABC transporter ATP-binding protein UgpC [candidate division Zixibacteria bacterium]|nr:sn-glycerol-3-phosphate ABC transporter ATP-binding protein UgpC [candidate division Zixibacteria bacterium]